MFSDAAHANLSDRVGSVGAHIAMTRGENGKCCFASWSVGKIKRVVRSSLAAEALSLQEAIVDGMYVRHILDMLESLLNLLP